MAPVMQEASVAASRARRAKSDKLSDRLQQLSDATDLDADADEIRETA